MTSIAIRHEFVDLIPDELVEGTLYVSIPYAIAVHKCMSGCGLDVVTPLSPADWELIFDGETVSLFPSVGNWSLPCESHYWIRRNRVVWAPRWSRAQIERGRDRDRAAKESYFDSRTRLEQEAPRAISLAKGKSLWARVKGWFS